MALWIARAGRHGEYENQFLNDKRVYLTWDALAHDLSLIKNRKELDVLLKKVYPNSKQGTLSNWRGQIWPFVKEMQEGDWIVLPSKLKSAAIHFAEIKGPYEFNPKAEDPFYHYRNVEWIATDIPRSIFDQDILYSFGAFKTVCQIKRNDAENRIRIMAGAGWKTTPIIVTKTRAEDKLDTETDLEILARDQIAKLIIRKFKGHGLTRLVEAILQAQGYITYRSPEGPDKGIDILAAPGSLGFGNPRICVQVKSSETPVDSPTLNQLIGSMQNVQAEQGLLVSWGGFKSSVDRELATQFFRVRLWDQDKLIDALLSNYDKLSEDLRAELPLKRIWTIAEINEENTPS
ncbi:restriction endonuclease [Chloroflexota bacterium]